MNLPIRVKSFTLSSFPNFYGIFPHLILKWLLLNRAEISIVVFFQRKAVWIAFWCGRAVQPPESADGAGDPEGQTRVKMVLGPFAETKGLHKKEDA
jgi:hypothetical protein